MCVYVCIRGGMEWGKRAKQKTGKGGAEGGQLAETVTDE